MIFFIKRNKIQLVLLLTLILTTPFSSTAQKTGLIKQDTIVSQILTKNKIGLNNLRNVQVYCPPSYDQSTKKFPVVYYLHNLFENAQQVISDFQMTEVIEKNILEKKNQEFIFVVADFSSPTIGSLYENSPTSGLWLDFIVQELVPYIDQQYQTIPNKDSRGVIGYFMGGRGALKVAMTHSDIFGVAYAMHPVATGSGYLPRTSLDIDWQKIHLADSYEELHGTGRTQIFTSICQAFLPNPNRPPFYCDFLFEQEEDGTLGPIPNNIRKEQKGFHLDETLDEYAENLRNMNAIAFDWARFDPTQAHVISNRRFSKLLMELNINHQGEEFAGNPWNKYWGTDGRFQTRVLPFLNKHLGFEKK